MRLTQKEQERLLIFQVAELARRRYQRGWKLNYVEASALICDELLERAREGKSNVANLTALGARLIALEDVIEGTDKLLPFLQLEALFPDGNKLISVNAPIRLLTREEACQDWLTMPERRDRSCAQN